MSQEEYPLAWVCPGRNHGALKGTGMGKDKTQSMIQRTALMVLAVYLLLTAGFAFLAGDQLRFRDSRGNVDLLPAESGTVELSQGAVVEQTFTTTIQRLESVSVQWGTYYRPNAGTVTMELWDQAAGQLLLSQTFDAAAIQEGGLTTLTAPEPMEGLYQTPLLLRIYADSLPGSAASPLMNQSAPARGDSSWLINLAL